MPIPPAACENIEHHIRCILIALGYDPTQSHLVDSPRRMARMMSEILDGNYRDPVDFMKKMTAFEETDGYTGMIAVHGANFYSFCAHHGMIFHGRFSLGYLPSKEKPRLLGLSKLVRIFREGCRHLTTQEAITQKALNLLKKVTDTDDAICWVDAEHTCMSCRGVQAHGARTTTIADSGAFATEGALRSQFIAACVHKE